MFQDTERKTIQVIAASTDIFNGNPDSDFVDCKDLLGLKFILACSSGAVGTATITVEKDTASDGSGTAVPFYYRKISADGTVGALTAATVAGFTTEALGEKTYEIFVNLAELGTAYRYVRLAATEVADAAVEGMALAELQPRTV